MQALRLNPGLRMLNFVGVTMAGGIIYFLIKELFEIKSEYIGGIGVVCICIFSGAFLLSIIYAKNERR